MIRELLQQLGKKARLIEPGGPREIGYIESLNGRLKDEVLNGEIFDMILEARVTTEELRKQCHSLRLNSSMAYWPPVPESFAPRQVANALRGIN